MVTNKYLLGVALRPKPGNVIKRALCGEPENIIPRGLLKKGKYVI